MVDFADTFNFVAITFNFVAITFNFVAITFNFVAITFSFVASFGNKSQQLEFDSLSWWTLPIRSTLLPIRSTLSPVCTGLYTRVLCLFKLQSGAKNYNALPCTENSFLVVSFGTKVLCRGIRGVLLFAGILRMDLLRSFTSTKLLYVESG